MVGLKKDQPIQLEDVDLYEYNTCYFPEKDYFNCDLVPIEWLELFETKKVILTLME
jgi:hypothetical protein